LVWCGLLVASVDPRAAEAAAPAPAAKPQTAPTASAPSTPSVPATPSAPAAHLQAERAQLSQRIAVAQRTLDSLHDAPPDNPQLEATLREIELLKQLDALDAQLESADESRREAESGKADVERKLSELRQRGPDESRPYSFLLLDHVRDE